MKTAIVILNWNGKKLLEQFLPSVVQYSESVKVYVIDNHSEDDSISFLNEKYPHISIIQNQENLGFAGGYNEGLKHIDADVYCLLNSDVAVTENWLNPVLHLFESNPNIAAIQPKILDYNQPETFEYAGAGGGFVDNLGYPYCRGRIFWTLEKDEGQYNDTRPIFWATGACLFIRSDDFWNQNGFDAHFFAHQEEIDLCWRLHNAHREVYYCGQSTVYHLGGGTLQSNTPRKTFLNFRNSLLMLVKNLPVYKLFPVLFSRLALDGITALVFWRYEGFGHLIAILKAHFSFYYNLPKYLKMRGKVKKDFGWHRFVPYQYFILKRRKLKQLK